MQLRSQQAIGFLVGVGFFVGVYWLARGGRFGRYGAIGAPGYPRYLPPPSNIRSY